MSAMNRCLSAFACALLGAAMFLAGTSAHADDTIKHPGDHPKYVVEIEPHGLWGWRHYYFGAPGDGLGLGARIAIPVVENGFVPSINNNVAVSFGIDWLHYGGATCYYYAAGPNVGPGPCYAVGDANYLLFPVSMQWNFFVAQRWSVFGEPGLVIYHGFFDYCTNVRPGTQCGPTPTETGIDFAFYAGGRFHFSDHATLTMRIGYPTFSVGVSFL
jgi:hypothetical protein